MATVNVDLIVEEDRRLGKPVFHVFTAHRPHVPDLTCPCKPHLGDLFEMDHNGETVIVEIWAHWKRSD